MIPGSIDPECEAVTVQGGRLCGKQTEIEGDGYVGSQTPPPPPLPILPSVTALPSPILSILSVTCFISCSSLSGCIPHLSAGFRSSFLSPGCPTGLLTPLSAAACTALARLVTDLFTCNPSYYFSFFFFFCHSLGSAASRCAVGQDEAAPDHSLILSVTRGNLTSKAATMGGH